jgi:transcriptional regulator with XRE-family HTH domain
MEREKPTFDILGRIEQERLARSWSEYALAENSGLTQSTISTWRRRNLQPNVASIEKICAGFGITLSQFFQEEDSVYLTKEQKELLDLWAKLSPAQREAVSKMLCAFLYIEEEP